MDKGSKGATTLWATVSIISLLCVAALLYFMLQERTKRIESEQRLAQIKDANRILEIKLEHNQSELSQLKDRAKVLADEVEQEKRNYQTVLAEAQNKDTQIKGLQNSLANEKRQRTSLANILAQLRENYDEMEENLKQARLKVDELSDQLARFSGKAGINLKKIVVKPKKKLSGKILVVNNEFHFVVIDLGREDEVEPGDEFIVYQGQANVGKVQVEKVYDKMCTAVILPGSQEEKIIEDIIVNSF